MDVNNPVTLVSMPSETPIHVVGIGLDGIRGLSADIQSLIQRATLLVGGDRHLSYFPDHPAPKMPLDSMQRIFDAVHAHVKTNAKPLAIILASGDPLFFGIGRLILQEFPADTITIHPHLSAIQLAFSRIKVPWQDAQLISAHGRSLQSLQDALEKSADKIAVFTDATHSPDAIARLLLALDRPHAYTIWVCENLGGADEQVRPFTADQLAAHPSTAFAPLNVVVLLRRQQEVECPIDLSELPVIGIPDRYFASFGDRPGLMTKREIRVLILSELALTPHSILWDIGAGTGSVSIEAARLCPGSPIYAIEKTAAGISLIHANRRRFQVDMVYPVSGVAPACLTDLPRPNHVFIGGSGGQLIPILNHCLKSLLPGGTLVIALATLERLSDALQWIRADDVTPYLADHRLVACQVARSLPVGNLTRLAPLNPVHLLSLRKAH